MIQQPKENSKLTAVQKRLNLYNTEEDPNKFTVLNNLEVPVSKLNQIRSAAKKVFRAFYKYFPSENDFSKHLNEFVEKQSQLNNSSEDLISKDILTKYISEFFKDKHQDKIDKKDVESFLSNFNYNKHGFTQMSVIPFMVYK